MGKYPNFAVYTNQSLNSVVACLDKGLALKLDGMAYDSASAILRLGLYASLALLILGTGWLLVGQAFRLINRPLPLGRAEAAFARQSLAFRASLALSAIYLAQPVSWIAYTLFLAPALAALALQSQGALRHLTLWALAVLALRLNYISDADIEALLDQGGIVSYLGLAGVTLYRACIGVALLGFWGYLFFGLMGRKNLQSA